MRHQLLFLPANPICYFCFDEVSSLKIKCKGYICDVSWQSVQSYEFTQWERERERENKKSKRKTMTQLISRCSWKYGTKYPSDKWVIWNIIFSRRPMRASVTLFSEAKRDELWWKKWPSCSYITTGFSLSLSALACFSRRMRRVHSNWMRGQKAAAVREERSIRLFLCTFRRSCGSLLLFIRINPSKRLILHFFHSTVASI